MKILVVLALLLGAGMVIAAVRSPAVAGAFYTGDAGQLRVQIERLLAAASPGIEGAVAVVMPHAGYLFSGPTAAGAAAALRGRDVERVILLGPSHHVRFGGAALPAADVDAFSTPLGRVDLDLGAMHELRLLPDFHGPASAHDPEHSLEVELPFLQAVAPRATVIPVLIGPDTDQVTCRRIARGIAPLLGTGTVVVASSDFSHHGSAFGWAPLAGRRELGDALVELGRGTAECLADRDPEGFWQQVEVSGDTVCGRRPLAVLAELVAHALQGEGRVLDVTTSGQVSGDWSRVVTYAAVAFTGEWRSWKESDPPAELGELTPEDGRSLVDLARATLATRLGHDASLARWFGAHPEHRYALAGPAGAFVTLHNTGERARRDGRLRACMGRMEALQPVTEAVISAAVSASTDPRFPPLELRELEQLSIEVSVLSPMMEVAGPEAIEVGRHGVLLSKGLARAVFLPQVASEQGWDRETMLAHLCRKAGLAADAWRRGARFEVFTAQVFSEEEPEGS